MLTVCWSVKGGVGTTVVTAGLALAAARSSPEGALAVDLAGDLPAALGLRVGPDQRPGVAEWLAASGPTPPDALGRLARPVDGEPRLQLLARGRGDLDAARGELLGSLLARGVRPAVVDAGLLGDGVGAALAARAERFLLVTSACLLALGRARELAVAPTGVVLVREPGRALRRDDVERALGVPVVLEVAVDPALARAVDAGLLVSRMPRAAQVAFAQAVAA